METEVTLIENTKIQKDINIPDFTQKWDDTNIVQLDLIESELEMSPIIDAQFVEDYFMLERLVDNDEAQINNFKKILQRFAETHNTGSFKSNGMQLTYTQATTTTTIDTTKLKATYPDIAAECSRTSARKASISLKECDK